MDGTQDLSGPVPASQATIPDWLPWNRHSQDSRTLWAIAGLMQQHRQDLAPRERHLAVGINDEDVRFWLEKRRKQLVVIFGFDTEIESSDDEYGEMDTVVFSLRASNRIFDGLPSADQRSITDSVFSRNKSFWVDRLRAGSTAEMAEASTELQTLTARYREFLLTRVKKG